MPPDIGAVSRWLEVSNVTYIVAVILVAAATFGIVYFGNKYTRLKELELESYKRQADSRIADANRTAADANAVAAAARADAEAARADGERFRKERVQLEIRLREMEESQSKLVATNTASQEEIKRLQKAAEPRTISTAQQAQIANLLRNFAGQEVEIRLYAQEVEARMLANQVADTLNKAGLKVQLNTMLGGDVAQGFGVVVHDDRSAPALATTILLAFRSSGVAIGSAEMPSQVPEGKFFIAIGAKPNTQ